LSEINHNCGIVVTHSLHDAYNMINSLQHRGREAAGIAGFGKNVIDVLKWKGKVKDFGLTDLHEIFPSHKYDLFMAHVRYATRGKKENILEDAHPITIGGKETRHHDHILINDCDYAIVHNGQVFGTCLDDICINDPASKIDSARILEYYHKKNEYNLIKDIPGAFTLAIADKRLNEAIIMRDKHEIRPGIKGKKDGKYIITSEDIALRKNGADIESKLNGGSIYSLLPNGNMIEKKIVQPKPKHCFFEWNYIGDIDSEIEGLSVRKARDELGRALAQQNKGLDADFVTYLPRCPKRAAKGYSYESGIEFLSVFYKKKNERSFQGSTKKERNESIKNNLYLVPGIQRSIRGKKIILIDDSIVRGNNSKHARDLLYSIGVKEIFFRSYTPPIGVIDENGEKHGCLYGVDMPPEDDFIIRKSVRKKLTNRNIKEVSKSMNMNVDFLTYNNLIKTFSELGFSEDKLCTYCIGGDKPF
jgi:amidophosphoribosyltransferase